MIEKKLEPENNGDDKMKEFLDRVRGNIEFRKLLACCYTNCPERGEYIHCFWDEYPSNCEIYRSEFMSRN